MYGFRRYELGAGHATRLGMEDQPAPNREAARRMVMTLFDDAAHLRGADRVTLHEDQAQDDFWEHRA
jgi:hypothetical protein